MRIQQLFDLEVHLHRRAIQLLAQLLEVDVEIVYVVLLIEEPLQVYVELEVVVVLDQLRVYQVVLVNLLQVLV